MQTCALHFLYTSDMGPRATWEFRAARPPGALGVPDGGPSAGTARTLRMGGCASGLLA